ncbi:glycosyltransferase family 2 protein [Lysinimonas soli]|uniref:Glycosyltransferase family 2 protein n=1 Tax=Lysinimonas soli TaxID=1074233 RepID=A0ABW0NUZ5_9MICO
MQPRVTAILVVRNGEPWLDRTLRALAAQIRKPDALVVVDCSSTDGSAEQLAAATPTQYVSAPNLAMGAAISFGLQAAAPAESGSDWLWLLSADTAPEPTALAELLAAVEVAPSVVIAGPKVVDPDDHALIRSYGESLSRFGATVRLVEDELDQAQHDADGDVLGVTSTGMLVQRAVWERLGGFDPGLPGVDAGLDFSIRARLAGFRVIRVADARVTRGVRPEDQGRRRPLSSRGRIRVARIAQLHRRMVYAPAAALPVHWLSLVPLALLRSIGRLLGKRPGAIPGELAAAFRVAFDGSVAPARARLRRNRTLGWASIAPLRIPGDAVRELRAVARDRASAENAEPDLVRAAFFGGGGAAVTLIGAVIGVGLFWRLIGASALSGGALLPLDGDVGALWSRLAWGVRNIGVDLTGPSDPFSAVLALLGSLTPWNTSFSIVLLWLAAMPLAALGAWWCATRFTEHRWPPAVAALLWMLAPPLLSALADGRPAAVLAHLLLPWLVLAAIEGAKSWSAAAAASLLFAATAACAPVLTPALLLAVVGWAFARPRGFVRLIGIPIPAIALFAPLVVAQLLRGNPLGLLADPGASVTFPRPTGWQLLLGLPSSASDGWSALAAAIGLPGGLGVLAPAVLLAPLAAMALLALFLPGSRRAIPAMIVALLGLVTAVVSAHLGIAAGGADVVTPWPGSGLSLYWLGLVAAVVVTLDAIGAARVVVGIAVLVTATISVAPLLIAPVLGTGNVTKSDGQLLPALVTAEATAHPGVGTLVLVPQDDGSLAVVVDRGPGTTLDESSTLWSTRVTTDASTRALATLAGNLASRSGYDPRATLSRFKIEFVVLPQASGGSEGVRQRAAEALDSTASLVPVGETSVGTLWRVPGFTSASTSAQSIGATSTAILVAQGVVIGLALLLAIPTGRRRRVVTEVALPGEDPADTFDEDENA